MHTRNANMHWDDLKFFLAVSRRRTLKAASKELKVDQATVGRRILTLQSDLGAKLLEKRSNGYFLTAAGERILSSVMEAENAVLAVDRLITGKDERAEGIVKIAMPGALANQWIVKELRPLLDKYPKLEIQFLTGPEVLNLSRRQADIAVRLVRPQQKELKTRKIGNLQLGLYVAKEIYPDVSKIDKKEFPFVGLFENVTSDLEINFIKNLGFIPNYRVRSAAWSSVYSAIQAGVGFGILPTFIGDRDKSLRILNKDNASSPYWLVYHPEVGESARVRVVVDFLVRVFEP